MRFDATILLSVVEVELLEHDTLDEEEGDGVAEISLESENTGETGST